MSKERLGTLLVWGFFAYILYVSIFPDKGEELESFPSYLIGDWQETSLISNEFLNIEKKRVRFERHYYEISHIETETSPEDRTGQFKVHVKDKCCEWLHFYLNRDGILQVHISREAGWDRYGYTRYESTKKKSFSNKTKLGYPL